METHRLLSEAHIAASELRPLYEIIFKDGFRVQRREKKFVKNDCSRGYSRSLPETVMKCWPLGDPCACTTATWAVTCWPFWLWPLGDVLSDSATRICESLESDDSNGTTSITLTLPDGAVCRIIFFCWLRNREKLARFIPSEELTWLKLTWCKATGVSCVARWTSDIVLVVFDGLIDVFASDSSFATDVTVMKFLVVANRVAIIDAPLQLQRISSANYKWRPNKTFLVITRTIRSDSSKRLVTNDGALQQFFFFAILCAANKRFYWSNKLAKWRNNSKRARFLVYCVCSEFDLKLSARRSELNIFGAIPNNKFKRELFSRGCSF